MKGDVRRAVLAGLLLLIAQVVLVQSVLAFQTYEVSLDVALYGTLNQNDVDTWNSSSVSCGPTAVTNSFVFLQNRYPGVYGNLLVPAQGSDLNSNGIANSYDDMIATARTLYSSTYMGTDPTDGGTYIAKLILGKQKYIEERVPGVTLYQAQVNRYWQADIPVPSYVQFGVYPTWNFLMGELIAGKDVEILLSRDGGGHYLTLRKFHWDDFDNDGLIDKDGNEAYIRFIDAWTGADNGAWIWQGLNGRIETSYWTNSRGVESWISSAVSECPVPEPSTFILIGLGLIGLTGIKWRQ